MWVIISIYYAFCKLTKLRNVFISENFNRNIIWCVWNFLACTRRSSVTRSILKTVKLRILRRSITCRLDQMLYSSMNIICKKINKIHSYLCHENAAFEARSSEHDEENRAARNIKAVWILDINIIHILNISCQSLNF